MNFRLASIEDVPGIVKTKVDTWRTTYQSIFPADFLQSLSYAENEIRWRKRFTNPERKVFIYIAETDSKEIVGFSMGSPEQFELALKIPSIRKYVGEIMAIYVLKQYQRKKIGLKLVKLIVERLVEKDIRSMIVWVLQGNPYYKFYEALGGKYVGQKMLEIEGVNYVEHAYGWVDIREILTI